MKTPKCKFCNRKLVISKIDMEKKKACLSCPDYMAGNDQHTSFFTDMTAEFEETMENSKKPVLYW